MSKRTLISRGKEPIKSIKGKCEAGSPNVEHQQKNRNYRKESDRNSGVKNVLLRSYYKATIDVSSRSKDSTDCRRVNRDYSVQIAKKNRVKKNACASSSSLLTHRVQESTGTEFLTVKQQKTSKLHAEKHRIFISQEIQ